MKSLILISAIALSTNIFAGPGKGHSHGHGHSHTHSSKAVSIEKTQEIGKIHIARLIKAGKLDTTWSDAQYLMSEKKLFNEKEEWVVSYTNDKANKEKKLYIFLKITGDFVAANFTGK